MTAALIENPPADNPEADVARADAVLDLVGQRLAETEMAVVEARAELRGLALLAEVDAGMAVKRDAVRARLKEAESRLVELMAAQEAARDLGREARARALAARRDQDWQACAEQLDEALTTARALDAVVQQAGALCQQLRQQQAEAVGKVMRHLKRVEHQISVQPPALDDTLRLALSNSGGPPVDPRTTLHLSADERDRASIAGMVEHHARTIMTYRSAPATEPKEADHG